MSSDEAGRHSDGRANPGLSHRDYCRELEEACKDRGHTIITTVTLRNSSGGLERWFSS